MRTTRPIVPVLVAGLAAVALAAGCSGDDATGRPAAAEEADPAPSADRPTITARGLGTVTGVPDVLTIAIGVETRAEQAADALADNNGRTQAVIDLLKAEGVAEADLQTADLSIFPTYTSNGTRITGYQVTNSLRVTLRDLDRSGQIIDAAAGAAGDAVRIRGLTLSIDDTSDLYAAARADAVRRAKAQAEQLAEAAGVALGSVRTITEAPLQGPGYEEQLGYAADAAGGAPVQAGTQDLTLTVTVVYDIA